jgi:hypothetical protein
VEARENVVEVLREVVELLRTWNKPKLSGRMGSLFLARELDDLDAQQRPHLVRWRLISIRTPLYRHKDESADRLMQMATQKRSAGGTKLAKKRQRKLRTHLLRQLPLDHLLSLTAKRKHQVSKQKMSLGSDQLLRYLLQRTSANTRIN